MDMKKKLEDAYAPDKEGRKERVVIGLSGGMDSMVSAYLLKIQKYELFAVTIAVGWDQFTGNKSQNLACHLDEAKIENIKEFCQQLKIPLHIIRASSDFQEGVVEEWMAAMATGTTSNACWSCHGLRMRLLHQKMLELDAKHLATGHYAKLFHHAGHDTYFVHTSNDEQHDQSALLVRLPPTILKDLMLPLSDLQKKEVLKLAENFGLEVREGQLRMHDCFPVNEKTVEYLEQRLPKTMSRPGDIMSLDGSEMHGEHKGVIGHPFGEAVKLENSAKREENYFGRYAFKERRMLLVGKDHFMRDKVHLVDCFFSDDLALLEPMKAVIELPHGNFVDCWVYPKNQKGVFIEWEGEAEVKPGEIVAVFRKRGKNAKVYLTGKVRLLPKKAAPEAEERDLGDETLSVDYGRDF